MTIGSIVDALHRIAPPALAEPWDNVGLLLGDRAAECDQALVSLEADAAALRRAASLGAQLIIAHHPVIFRPVARVTADDPAGAVLLRAARAGIAVAAAHTNYDAAHGGVSHVLAERLGLRDPEPLARTERSGLAKLVVFTPQEDLDAVLAALDDSGAGHIGRYRECTFRSPGTGTFRPLAGARPAVGQVGRREEVAELRVESIVPLALAAGAVAAVRRAHSYEEPAIDVVPLEGGPAGVGIGLWGRLPRAEQAGRLLARVKKALGVRHVRVVGSLRRRVERAAVCGGAGGKLIRDALRCGCQFYLTGDVTHHDALLAADAGLVVVDAGHAATEAPALAPLAARLRSLCPSVAFAVAPRSDPFRYR